MTAHLSVEILWSILFSSFLSCWYWTIGFPTDMVAYTYLMLGTIYMFSYCPSAKAIAVPASTAKISAICSQPLFVVAL